MVSMTNAPTEYRLYGDLALWWPLISPWEEYADDSAYVATVLSWASVPVHDVLELGSGGGHNAVHLKARFAMTLVDLSAEMLKVSQRLNPECDHHRGDMRTVRLGRTFDAVIIHDAVDYMTTETDLRQAVETAFAHCRPGGIAVFVPDRIAETFKVSSGYGGSDDAGGRGARFLEWTWDPDPTDTWTRSDYAFLLRDTDGSVNVVHEAHRMGLFSRDVWLRLLGGAGFWPQAVTEQATGLKPPRGIFVGHRHRG